MHFCKTLVSLTLWSFLQVQSRVFETQDLNFWNLSVELTNVTPKAVFTLYLFCHEAQQVEPAKDDVLTNAWNNFGRSHEWLA